MDKRAIHTVAIVISILGCFWVLNDRITPLNDKITENSIVLAEVKGAMQAHIDRHVHMHSVASAVDAAQ